MQVEYNAVVIVIALLMLLVATHLVFIVRYLATSEGLWRFRILKWGSLPFIPLLLFIATDQSRNRSVNLMATQGTLQIWSMWTQLALQPVGLLAVIAGVLLLIEAVYNEKKPVCLAMSVLVILIGLMLTGTTQWAVVLSVVFITIAVFVQRTCGDSRCGAKSQSPAPTESSTEI